MAQRQVEKHISSDSQSDLDAKEFDRVRKMRRDKKWNLELPSGAKIQCANEEEYKELRIQAKPYIDAAEILPSDAWNDIGQYLSNCLNYFSTNNKIVEIRRNVEKIEDEEERKSYDASTLPIVSEFSKQLDRLQRVITTQRTQLDFLRDKSTEAKTSLTDFIEETKEETLDFANQRKGENQYMIHCPSPICKHNSSPFIMINQQHHFAFDFAVSPYIIWNQEIFLLTKKFYTPKEDWDEELYKFDTEGLSFSDGAKILRISPIGWLAAIWEKQVDGDVEFPIDLENVINDIDLLAQYVPAEESVEEDDDEEVYLDDEEALTA